MFNLGLDMYTYNETYFSSLAEHPCYATKD